MIDRRDLLARSAAVAALLASAGLLPAPARAAWSAAAFEARNMADALKALGAGAPVESEDVTLVAPEIAENGAVVPVTIASTLAGVSRLILLVEKNPAALSAVFEIGPGLEPSIATRVKMNQTCQVIAVATTASGLVRFAQKEVKVTLGGCGG